MMSNWSIWTAICALLPDHGDLPVYACFNALQAHSEPWSLLKLLVRCVLISNITSALHSLTVFQLPVAQNLVRIMQT